jgi:putative ubiquitin-RnfH superfamily antitoxin RatB of RatAB toxin-antitoxin module
MRVHVAFVGAGRQALVALDMPPGSRVIDAVATSGLGLRDEVNGGRLVCAVFGRRVDHASALRDGDRVEITRPLVCDPMAARHTRAARKR